MKQTKKVCLTVLRHIDTCSSEFTQNLPKLAIALIGLSKELTMNKVYSTTLSTQYITKGISTNVRCFRSAPTRPRSP